MNHGPDFQALWNQLRNEVIALQAKGYYGDGNDQANFSTEMSSEQHLGMWSSGTRLADSANIISNGPMESDLPEYMVMKPPCPRLWHAHHFVTSVEAHRGAHALRHADDVNNEPLGRPL